MREIPLFALQHWLFCPRQCALIHLEQVWAENQFTAEGRVMHQTAHEGADETRKGIRNTYNRSAQYAAAADPALCLFFAKEVVRAKIANQRVILQRNGSNSGSAAVAANTE